jgi:CheY-like chemotaxis protein/HPt (histidine-containing phosphotransfer) domain-containing protein
MTGVLVITSQLNDSNPEADHRMLAESVLVSGEGLSSILNDIVDFAKVEAGQLELESIAFDLRSLVQDVVDVLGEPAHLRGLDLECRFPADMPASFRGDPGLLRRVVTDLVGNALRYTPSGEALLELIVEEPPNETAMVRFEVVGVGFGITRAHQPALFESFSQSDADTVRSYGAAGLGLAMSHQLVELIGGQMGLRNELGHGSTFWFNVPLQRTQPVPIDTQVPQTAVPDVAGEPDASARAAAKAPDEPAASGRILLAEDNLVNQRVAAAMLENLGVQFDIVADGAEAVKAALATSYRAILMDGQMPILDGYQATGEIRRLQGDTQRTPIIAVTGSTMKSDQQRCMAAGMDDYLAKPLDVGALQAVLTRWGSAGADRTIVSGTSGPAPPSHVGLDHLDDPDRPVLDVQAVERLERLGESAGEDLLGELAPLFLTDADARVAALREAISRDDAAAVVRSAHTLSGASANLGATVLARLCATLAADGSVGDLTDGEVLLDTLEDELERVRGALESASSAPC